jgi:4'-phosphopantetheinyl transferase
LLAVADRAVGVDLECVRQIPDMANLVERCFAAEEKAKWRELSREAQPLAFFRAWTRKEAWLKAVGKGFSFPLEQLAVTFVPGEPSRVLSVRGDPVEASHWWLDSCEPAAGHVAAAAVRGMSAQVSRWRWEFGNLRRSSA